MTKLRDNAAIVSKINTNCYHTHLFYIMDLVYVILPRIFKLLESSIIFMFNKILDGKKVLFLNSKNLSVLTSEYCLS